MPASPAQYVSPLTPHAASALVGGWGAWALVSACALVWLGLVVGAPLAAAGGHEATAFVLYRGLKAACHQMPERAYWLAGHPLAVCARCFGIYAGFAAGALAYPLVSRLSRRAAAPRREWFIVALLPTTIDFTLGITGLWANTHTSRSLTGAWLGALTAFFVVPGVIEIARHQRASRAARRQQQRQQQLQHWAANKSEVTT